jgi:hypothetical protein
VIVDLAVSLLVPQRGGSPLRDHVPLKFSESGRHGDEHLAHAARRVHRLTAHVHEVQGNPGLLPLLHVAQGVYGVPKQPVELQRDDMTDTLRCELGDLLALWALIELNFRRDSPFANHLHQVQPLDAVTGATTANDILSRIFSTFCIGK